jgi:hypothetical protein
MDFRGQNYVTNYEDFILQPKPANPPNTVLRLYADSTLASLTAINSIGNAAIGAGSGSIGAAINVQVPSVACPNCLAKGDAQLVSDGAWAGTGPNFTSATANFKSTDVGKIFWCNNPATGLSSWALTTIKAFVSSTTVTLAVNATLSAGGSQYCVWGTQDDTASLQAATTAAKVSGGNALSGPPFLNPYAKSIYLPPGGYIVSGPPFNFLVTTGNEQGVSLYGDSMGTSVIFPTPTFSQTGVGGNQGFILNAYGAGNRFQNFGINGAYFTFNNTGNTSIINAQCSACVFDHVSVQNYPIAVSAGNINIGGNGVSVIHSQFQNNTGSLGAGISCQTNGASSTVFYRTLCSNNPQNLVVNNQTGFGIGGTFSFINSVSDECGTPPCTRIVASKDVNITGSIIWGSGNQYAMSVDGTSIVRISQSFVGPYNGGTNVGGGVNISSGGVVIATESVFGYAGAASNENAVNGPSGATFQDVGGNIIGICAPECTMGTTATFNTHLYTGGINPVTSLTHTWNTCTLPVTFQATTVGAPICNQFIDQNLQLTRIKASSLVSTTCVTAPVVTISDGTNTASLTLTSGASSWDSGALVTLPFTTGNVVTVINTIGSCVTPPVGLAVTYNMQSVLNL